MEIVELLKSLAVVWQVFDIIAFKVPDLLLLFIIMFITGLNSGDDLSLSLTDCCNLLHWLFTCFLIVASNIFVPLFQLATISRKFQQFSAKNKALFLRILAEQILYFSHEHCRLFKKLHMRDPIPFPTGMTATRQLLLYFKPTASPTVSMWLF